MLYSVLSGRSALFYVESEWRVALEKGENKEERNGKLWSGCIVQEKNKYFLKKFITIDAYQINYSI